MIVIRRMDTAQGSFTAIFLPGEPAKVFPTTDREHARILQIYKQDKPYADVLNDFTDFELGPEKPAPAPAKQPSTKTGRRKPRRLGRR